MAYEVSMKLGHWRNYEIDELSKKDVLSEQWIGKLDFYKHYVENNAE